MATLPSRQIGAVDQVARAESRRPALWRSRLERDGEADLKVVVRNVSRSGFMGIATGHVPAGTLVRLHLPFGGSVGAHVRWSLNNHIGCRLTGRLGNGQLGLLVLASALGGLFTTAGLRILFIIGGAALVLLA